MSNPSKDWLAGDLPGIPRRSPASVCFACTCNVPAACPRRPPSSLPEPNFISGSNARGDKSITPSSPHLILGKHAKTLKYLTFGFCWDSKNNNVYGGADPHRAAFLQCKVLCSRLAQDTPARGLRWQGDGASPHPAMSAAPGGRPAFCKCFCH